MECIRWRIFCHCHAGGDGGELVEVKLVICQTGIAQRSYGEVALQDRTGLTVNHERQRLLPVFVLVVINEGTHAYQFAPVVKCLTDARIGPFNLAACHLHVEVKAMGPHVEIIKPTGGCPKPLRTDGIAFATRRNHRFAV